MKIYLAGKISKLDWRHTVMPRLRSTFANEARPYLDGWPLLEGALWGHDYTGPFFIGCDHGCYHGPSTHGAGDGTGCNLERSAADHVPNLCREAIRRSELVFVWIEDLTSFGTFLELGYALGLSRKTVVLGHPPQTCKRPSRQEHGYGLHHGPLSELWFYPGFVESAGGKCVTAWTPTVALRRALGHHVPPNEDRPVSPLPGACSLSDGFKALKASGYTHVEPTDPIPTLDAAIEIDTCLDRAGAIEMLMLDRLQKTHGLTLDPLRVVISKDYPAIELASATNGRPLLLFTARTIPEPEYVDNTFENILADL